ncbi:hypothetical protein MRX96_053063 [Rhipicephalus microplus]
MATAAARYWSLSQGRRCDVRLATAAAPHDEILSFSECALKESLMAIPCSADGKKRLALFLFNARGIFVSAGAPWTALALTEEEALGVALD